MVKVDVTGSRTLNWMYGSSQFDRQPSQWERRGYSYWFQGRVLMKEELDKTSTRSVIYKQGAKYHNEGLCF